MEPMVIFSAGLVVYCGYLTLGDLLRDVDRERRRAIRIARAARNKPCPGRSRASVTSSGRGREDAGGARWPALLKGSV